MIEKILNTISVFMQKPLNRYSLEDISQIEKKFEKNIPLALKDFYMIIGKNKMLSIIPLEDIEILDNKIIFLKYENTVYGIEFDRSEKNTRIVKCNLSKDTKKWYYAGRFPYFLVNGLVWELYKSMFYKIKLRGSKRFKELIKKKLIRIGEDDRSEYLISQKNYIDKSQKCIALLHTIHPLWFYVGSNDKERLKKLFENSSIDYKIS